MEFVKMCEICGKEFVKTGNRQKYCKECKREKKQVRYHQLICPVCGSVFTSTRSFKIYCGKECRAKKKYDSKKAWRAENKEKHLARERMYRKTLKGRSSNIACIHRRRFGGDIDKNYIETLLLSKTCYYCGVELTEGNIQIDHKTPICKGGTNDNENLAACCIMCNFQKNDKTEQEYMDWLEEMKRAGVNIYASAVKQAAYHRWYKKKKRQKGEVVSLLT